MDINLAPRFEARRFAVIGDTHFGVPASDYPALVGLLKELKDHGVPIVLNGDIWDSLVFDRAIEQYPLKLGQEDILLYGNHDFYLEGTPPKNRRFHVIVESGGRSFFITHGDQLDFWAAVLLMADKRAPLPLSLVQGWKRFRLEDVFWLYYDMISTPGNLLDIFSRDKPFSLSRTVRVVKMILKHLLVPVEKGGARFMGVYPYEIGTPSVSSILAIDPAAIARRFEDLWPSLDVDAVIFGHLHRSYAFAHNGRYYYGHGSAIAPHSGDRSFLYVEDGKVHFCSLPA